MYKLKRCWCRWDCRDLGVPVHLPVDGLNPAQDDLYSLVWQILERSGKLEQLVRLHFLCAALIDEAGSDAAEQLLSFIRHLHHTHTATGCTIKQSFPINIHGIYSFTYTTLQKLRGSVRNVGKKSLLLTKVAYI